MLFETHFDRVVVDHTNIVGRPNDTCDEPGVGGRGEVCKLPLQGEYNICGGHLNPIVKLNAFTDKDSNGKVSMAEPEERDEDMYSEETIEHMNKFINKEGVIL